MEISIAEIEAAARELSRYLTPSPLLYNTSLSEAMGCEVHLKLENMQPIGSFKIRGATYKISKLSPEEKKLGVITASAGNHAQGVAWGSRRLGVSSLIVMPRNATLVKIQNTKALGAQVVLEGDNFDEASAAARRIMGETGRVYVPAFEDPLIIAGQGTAGLEILQQLPDVDYVIGATGGGGLMAGLGIALKAKRPQVQLIGAQAAGASVMADSFHAGKPLKTELINTFADGIAMKAASAPMLAILKKVLDDVVKVADEEIAAALLVLLEKAKTVVEGAGAVSLAALMQPELKAKVKGKKVVVVVSGGNIDVNVLSRIIDRGLIRAGRRLRVNVWISDRPGSLARLTDLIAKEGANVLQTIHDRSEPSTTIEETEVNLTLETKGPEHGDKVIDALKNHVLRLELAH
jgi:threonine dehydratase